MQPASIKKKTIVSICLFLAVLLGIIASTTLLYFKQTTRKMLFDQQVATADIMAKGLDEKLISSHNVLLDAAQSCPLTLLDDQQAAQKWLEDRQLVHTLFRHGIFLLDEQGRMIVFNGEEPHHHSIPEYYRHLYEQTLNSNKAYIGPPGLCPQTGHPIVIMTALLYDQNGKVRGLLGGGLDLLEKNGVFGGILNFRVGATGYSYLFASNRTMIIHPDPSRILKKDVPPTGMNKLFDRATEGFEGAGETMNSKGLPTLVSFKRLKSTGWILAINFPVDEAYAPINLFLNYFLLGISGCLLLSIFLAVKISSTITVPLLDLAVQADEISNANHSSQFLVNDRYSGEIAILATAFNRMLAKLNQRMSEFELNLHTVFDNTDEGIVIHDQQGHILAANRPAMALFGGDETAFQSLTVFELSAESMDKNKQIPLMIRRIMGGEPLSIEWRCRRLRDNSTFDSEIYYTRIIWNNEPVLMGMVQDITERKQREALIHRLSIAIEQSANIVLITDRQGVIQYVNPGIQLMTGYSIAETIGKTPRILKSGYHPPEFYAEMWATITSNNTWRGEFCNRHKDGRLIWGSTVITPITENREITHFVAIMTDTTLRKHHEQELYRQANFDELTGLPNRNFLIRQVRESIANTKHDCSKVILMLLDLDDFKTINDTMGHSVGDLLLQAVAERLQSFLSPDDMVARMGGDEFAIAPLHISEFKQAVRLASRVMHSFIEPFDLQGQEVFITASMGIAVFPEDGQEMEDLLRNADTAMYYSKSKERNSFKRYNSELNNKLQEKMQLTGLLRRALERNEFLLYFQPQQELATGRVLGFESLLRWQPQNGKMVYPDQFIPLLEETGLIVPVGEWVLRETCYQVKRWQESGIIIEHASVNISFRQFQRPDIVERILAIVEESGVNPTVLCMELTESIMIENFQENLTKLSTLRAAGIAISVDDFGTGYSSLAYLRQMQIHELKIDKSFILSLQENTSLVKAILAMAQSLELRVVAEGVETEEQRNFLITYNCEVIQGYLLSQPLPMEQFEVFIRSFQ
jgi:diguanylate cyclase (GGDEF)-like protein/PAS domain S-box-containing protein